MERGDEDSRPEDDLLFGGMHLAVPVKVYAVVRPLSPASESEFPSPCRHCRLQFDLTVYHFTM